MSNFAAIGLFARRSAIFFSFCILSAAALPAQEKLRGITAEDYLSFEFVSDPRISPDGKWVAYVMTTIDQRLNRRISNIWLVPANGSSPPRQFTNGAASSSSPRWSPDGQSLAFLSSRPDTPSQSSNAIAAVPMPGPSPVPAAPPAQPEGPRAQVYLLSLSGGEAMRLTNLKNGVNSFQWSPDGTNFVVVGRTGIRDDRPSKSDVRHYEHMSYKFNDSGWFDDKRTHIFVVNAKTGAAKQITSGDDWNDSDPQWSPDGTRIAFVSDRTGKAFEESQNTDVWVINADGTGTLTKISDHDESDDSPRWSPDGKTIAFTGQIRSRDHAKIWVAPAAGASPSVLAANGLDLLPGNLKWAEGGKALYFETGVKGEAHLFRVDIASKAVKQVTSGPRAVRSIDINGPTGTMVYASNTFERPDDIFIAKLNGSDEKRLTQANDRLWRQLQMQDVERFTYKGADGWDIDGFLVKPLGWAAGKKYPMILSIHGGPAGQYGVDWYQEFQVYAARGWAVLFTNPRGSTGYGQKFERGIEGEWGRNDYTDVMNGVEAALNKYPWVDRDRLGVTGGSYGGYLTNWIVGHTNIFKAAVTLRSVVNFISDEGTRDGAYGHKDDFGGDLFEKFDLFWDRSPLKFAKNVKTPTLILHSENDFRVPLEQGEQWFRALRHYGVTSEFVIFPRENHNLTRTGEPKHLVESMNWQIYWFDRFLNNNAAAVPPDR